MLSLLLFLTTGVLIGCEENLAPRVPYDLPFSLYGVLSPDLDTQSVRVYPVADLPSFDPSVIEDIRVTSTDLHTGTQMTWRDSVIVEPNGQHEYIFWAPFRAEFDHQYRIEAKRLSDGARSWADVRVPPQVTVRFVDDDATAMKAIFEGEDIRLLKPELEYGVCDVPCTEPLIIYVNYEGHQKPTEQGWEVTFNMASDRYYVQGIYMNDNTDYKEGIKCSVLKLMGLEFHTLIGDEVWSPPGGIFDVDILSYPQTMSNVKNGLGFIGGGYRIQEPLYPRREVVEDACFIYDW